MSSSASEPLNIDMPIWKRLRDRFLEWLLLSILVGLLPILLRSGVLLAYDAETTRLELFGDGELYIAGAGLTAAGIGKLFLDFKSPRQGSLMAHAYAAVFALLVTLFGSVLYILGPEGLSGEKPGAEEVLSYATLSMAMFVVATITSLSCILVSEFGGR